MAEAFDSSRCMLPPESVEVQAFQVDDHPAFCRSLTRYRRLVLCRICHEIWTPLRCLARSGLDFDYTSGRILTGRVASWY